MAYRTVHVSLARFSRTAKAQRLDWLSAAEQRRLQEMRHPGGRELWLAGRWLVKQLLAEELQFQSSLNRLHVESRDGQERRRVPQAFIDGKLLPHAISLSHSAKTVLAVTSHEDLVGCDVVSRTQYTPRFREYWLGPMEQRWLGESVRPESFSMLWGLKETCFKALGEQSSFVPRRWDSIAILRSLGITIPRQLNLNAGQIIQYESQLAEVRAECLASSAALLFTMKVERAATVLLEPIPSLSAA